jgi:hypothetical protein
LTTARTEQLDALRCLPDGEPAQILQWGLVEQRSTCDIAKLLGISEMEAEARYQNALLDLQRRRRQDVDGMLLVWDARDRTGKARFGGVSIELERAPDIGITRLRRLDILPGRIAELRVSGHGTRRLSPIEHERAIAWLRTLASTLRAAAAPLLANEHPSVTAPMPLTDWPSLEQPPLKDRSTP